MQKPDHSSDFRFEQIPMAVAIFILPPFVRLLTNIALIMKLKCALSDQVLIV